jgi:hypothetical protein
MQFQVKHFQTYTSLKKQIKKTRAELFLAAVEAK